VDRRSFVQLLGLAGAATGMLGHSPYRQWQVYRQSRLIIVTSAADSAAYPLAERVAALLLQHWPESRALASRASDTREVVKLLASQQLDVAIFSAAEARDAAEGRGRFAAEGALPLRALGVLGAYLLVCREDFPADRAEAVARILTEHWRPEAAAARAPRPPIPFHAGVPPAVAERALGP
jgi:TRAP-type uncharacterized transport system substrate-binding protein